jgi:uncharacterized membrane protein YdcZ (DUF606 family)
MRRDLQTRRQSALFRLASIEIFYRTNFKLGVFSASLQMPIALQAKIVSLNLMSFESQWWSYVGGLFGSVNRPPK